MRYPGSEKLESETLSAIGPRKIVEPYGRSLTFADTPDAGDDRHSQHDLLPLV